MRRRPRAIHVALVTVLVLGPLGLGCDEGGPTPPAEQPRDLLFGAWAAKDQRQLQRFFAQWYERSVPLSPEALAAEPEWVRAVYALHTAFYDPMHLEQYGSDPTPEVGDGYYAGVRYVVVQGSIRVRFEGSPDEQSIADFRPLVRVQEAGVLYLTDEYRRLLLEFLDVSNGYEEAWRRLRFLYPFILVTPGHWFGWHLETHPEAQSVLLAADGARATVAFRICYEGGNATLDKSDGGWLLTESHLTWIE